MIGGVNCQAPREERKGPWVGGEDVNPMEAAGGILSQKSQAI